MSYIARHLKTLRESAGLSIPRLASLANVNDGTIRGLEDNTRPRHADRPPFTVTRRDIDAIASALAVDFETLGAVDVYR